MLHTSVASLAGYYGTQGYTTVPLCTRVLDVASLLDSLPGPDVAANPYTSKSVIHVASDPHLLETMSRLYTQGASHLVGCFERSNAYWRQWVADVTKPGSGYDVRAVFRDDGTCVAYGINRVAAGPVFGGLLQITEYFCSMSTDEEKQKSFQRYLADSLSATHPRPTRVRVVPMTIDPAWIGQSRTTDASPSEDHARGASSEPLSGTPVKEGGTLVAACESSSGSMVWMDHGQMFRLGPRLTQSGRDLGTCTSALCVHSNGLMVCPRCLILSID